MKNISLAERVCESFYADNLSDALKSVENLQNIGELRFDLCNLNHDNIPRLKKATEKELIFTCRTGKLSKTIAANAYQKAMDAEYDYIDIDFFMDGDLLQQLHSLGKTKLILSYHNYDETPPKYELINILDELKSAHPHILKLATLIKSDKDIQVLKELQQDYSHSIIIGMGKWAVKSRINSLKAGAPFTYLSLDSEKITAIGQIGFQEFQENYIRFRGAEEIKLAVLGDPIAHSKSPELFKNLFIDDEINGVYEKIEIKDIRELETLKKHYDGFNITAPFKQSIIPYLNELKQAAKSISAVNTVYQKNGKWIGDNTDYKGIIEAINSTTDISKIENCLIIGAGGAARAAVYAMNHSKINSTILNRTFSTAKDLADEFEVSAIEQVNLNNYQLIINTVPKAFSIINPKELNRNHIVLDAIYPNSAFSRFASEIGFTLIRGEVWLREQALEAYRIFVNGKNNLLSQT